MTALAVPEGLSVALGEIVADVREGLLAMAMGTGLQVMAAIMTATENQRRAGHLRGGNVRVDQYES